MATTLTSTGITFPDASTQTTAATGGVGGIQYFASSGTFSIPTGTTSVKVTCVGGGGGGTSTYIGPYSQYPGGHGGYGGQAVGVFDATSGGSITITVGAGGTGSNNTTGGSGGASTATYGTKVVTANGGAAGNSGSTNTSGNQGASGYGSGASVMISGDTYGAIKTNGTTAGAVWVDTAGLAAGMGGSRENTPNAGNARGGVGGVVIVEWA